MAGEMIAAQSQLEGLRQIYTENNARVRSLNARVGEFRKQLEKLGGTQAKSADGGTASASPSTDPAAAAPTNGLPYPTIRSLPLLGAKYADFYRRAKIQETVFELLTQQYELAKVQEAKEIPSVKILDPARIPERKSFPPRLVIMILGTFLVCAMSVVWVLGSARWEADPHDPRKVWLHEVAGTLKAQMPWASRNGGGAVSGEKDSVSQENGDGPHSGGPSNP
jgi:capsule polysaccharide export protein KpsE/RkpR